MSTLTEPDTKPNTGESTDRERDTFSQIAANLRNEGVGLKDPGTESSATSNLNAREIAAKDQMDALRRDGKLPPEGSTEPGGVKDAEETSQQPPDRWDTDVSKKPQGKVTNLKRKSASIITAISLILGGGLGIISTAQVNVSIFIHDSISDTNDDTSKILERRAHHQFIKDIARSGSFKSTQNALNLRTKMDVISKFTLDRLEKKGVKAIYAKGQAPKAGANPTHRPISYEIDMGPGSKPRKRVVSAKKMGTFVKNPSNINVSRRVLGKWGFVNFRVRSWMGKHIGRFYQKVDIRKDRGIIKKTLGGKTITERASAWAKEKVPGIKRVDSALESIQAKATKQVRVGKRAGFAYMAALGACVGVKAPGFVASAFAKVQLAQSLTVLMDVVLNPGSIAKTAFYGDYDQEDSGTSGNILTKRVYSSEEERAQAHGRAAKSALESAYLLSAMGIEKGKLPIPAKIAPGYSTLVNPIVLAANKLDQNEEWSSYCNVIMSPQAMYTALGLNVATTVVSAGTLVGPLLNIAASWAVSELAIAATKAISQELLSELLEEFLKNDHIANAAINGGEDLGDVLGVGASAFFMAGGMARFAGVLSEAALPDHALMMQEVRDFEKQADIATLSPFDVSSKYTFLGSIVHSIQVASLSSGYQGGRVSSVLSSILKLPATSLGFISNDTAKASTLATVNRCSYAKDWGLDTGDPKTTPAVTISGVPCVGLTKEQDSMDKDDAIDLMVEEGWVDDNMEIGENDDIQDLIDKEMIKPNTPLMDFIESCGDPESGMYLLNAPGCISNKAATAEDLAKVDTHLNVDCSQWIDPNTGEVTNKCASSEEDFDNTDMPKVKNAKSLAAISVFLLDYQVAASARNEDRAEGLSMSSSAPADFAGDLAWPVKKDYESNKSWWLRGHPARSATIFPSGGRLGIASDLNDPLGTPIYALIDGVVTRVNLPSSKPGGNGGLQTESRVQGGVLKVAYAHGSNVTKRVGDTVKAGEQIMTMNKIGNAATVHLHLEMVFNDRHLCPQDVFKAMGEGAVPDFSRLTDNNVASHCMGRDK